MYLREALYPPTLKRGLPSYLDLRKHNTDEDNNKNPRQIITQLLHYSLGTD